MKLSRVEQAARNNAIWCDTVCRLHGVAGEFLASAWINRHRAPAYYPNLVTLRQAASETTALKNVRDLIDLNLRGQWAVKDSFQNLDLSELGFDKLFEASWIWHEPPTRPAIARSTDMRWTAVTSTNDFPRWEAAWSKANPAGGQSPKFPAALLADNTVAVFAGYQGQQLIAGGIANSSDAVVGLSNIFAPPNREAQVWAGLLTCTQGAFPKKPMVGYEHGPNLETALTAGFEKIGALTVWLRRL